MFLCFLKLPFPNNPCKHKPCKQKSSWIRLQMDIGSESCRHPYDTDAPHYSKDSIRRQMIQHIKITEHTQYCHYSHNHHKRLKGSTAQLYERCKNNPIKPVHSAVNCIIWLLAKHSVNRMKICICMI